MNAKPLVLIVEDSPTQAKEVAATVANCGARTLVAANGLDALNLVDQEHPMLVVLDVNLPRMDGYQVCSRLKRDPDTACIRVIMLTTADSADATIYGLDMGADDYIPKDSFAMENLTVALKAYMGMK